MTHDRPTKLRALLDSIRANPGLAPHHVVIVDDSAEPIRYETEFPELPIRMVRSDERLFISGAKNRGLGSIDTEYLFVVDDDNILRPDSFGFALGVLSSEADVGAVMPSVLYHGRTDLVWVYAAPLDASGWEFDLVGRNRPREPRMEGRTLRTDALPNASFLRTAAVRAVGGWNQRLSVNSSADLCERLQRAGFRTLAGTGSFVEHVVEAPGHPGYWAEHAAEDPDRCYFEVRDWFRWQQERHGHERGFLVRAMVRAGSFVGPLVVGIWARPVGKKLRPSVKIMRGYVAGVREAARGA